MGFASGNNLFMKIFLKCIIIAAMLFKYNFEDFFSERNTSWHRRASEEHLYFSSTQLRFVNALRVVDELSALTRDWLFCRLLQRVFWLLSAVCQASLGRLVIGLNLSPSLHSCEKPTREAGQNTAASIPLW